MRWGQIQDDKGRRAVCMHEETIYELPAKLSPLLQFYSRYRTNFGNPANAVSILRENGATTLGHGENSGIPYLSYDRWTALEKSFVPDSTTAIMPKKWDSKSQNIPPSSRNIRMRSSAPTKKFKCLLQTKPEAQK